MTNLTPSRSPLDNLEANLNSFLGNPWPNLNRLSSSNTGYPFHNILKRKNRKDQDEFLVEVALAGFSKDEIDVYQKEDVLTIKSIEVDEGPTDSLDEWHYIHKGISKKSFTRQFIIGKDLILDDAEYTDGILKITFHHEVPEEERPRSIKIK